MDVSQYLEIFLDESKEHLQSLNTEILNLEQDSENENTVNEIFRAAHSLKGMAGTMGYKRMQALTHDMENVFSEVRAGNIKVKSNMIDILFQCLDALEEYLNKIQETGDEGTNDNEPLIKLLNGLLEVKENTAAAPAGEAKKEKKEEAAKTVSADAGELRLEESQIHVLEEAMNQGKNAYFLMVRVQESCILKAARAFLVFKALEDLGEVIESDPPVQDIEDEKFELEFSLVFVTDESLEKVLAAVRNVSEIESAEGEKLERSDLAESAAREAAAAAKNDQNADLPAQQKTQTTDRSGQPAVGSVMKANDKKPQVTKPVVNRTVRVDIEKLDVLMNLVSELIIAKNSLVSASGGEKGDNVNFNEQIEYLERVTTNLHESVMKVRMVPIESVVNRFPRMIRDLSKKLNKKMELYMTGEDTELDRTVIDEIGDPLMHLLRNAADHGLESNEERIRAGKPEVGSIFLDAYQDGNNVVIEVRDDGGGIDVKKIKKKALDKGTITEEQAATMQDKDFIEMLFKPSFSTAEKVSDVSGRGVGLDVVKNKIEGLGGDVECKTKLGEGSNFIIRLPLTLAIIQALMVELGSEKYAIPLGSIQTIEDIAYTDIKYVQTREVINLRGAVIPLIRLGDILDVEPPEVKPESLTVVIVSKGEKLAGLVVDNLIGQQEIVIKSIGKYINNNKIISGATILGDGEVALIIDANTLV